MECSRNYLDPFLKYLNCEAAIVGHTPVNGVELHGNQLVVSSSFGLRKKKHMLNLILNKKSIMVEIFLKWLNIWFKSILMKN